ncbi:hypothetical protein BDZ45DRAFT_800279 [Acephala macrosclerotiorum]|nr:hypothetical protein BDZ45DRAFT_800279 [Acephala macrosclerotiorum]
MSTSSNFSHGRLVDLVFALANYNFEENEYSEEMASTRLTPVEPLDDWLEDFALWTISDGLEFRKGGREYGEAAAVWLIIAGSNIWCDPAWGKRDGNPGPGILMREGGIWNYRLGIGATQDMRWAFWRERLLEISSDESLDESTRETALQAERAMREIETSKSESRTLTRRK